MTDNIVLRIVRKGDTSYKLPSPEVISMLTGTGHICPQQGCGRIGTPRYIRFSTENLVHPFVTALVAMCQVDLLKSFQLLTKKIVCNVSFSSFVPPGVFHNILRSSALFKLCCYRRWGGSSPKNSTPNVFYSYLPPHFVVHIRRPSSSRLCQGLFFVCWPFFSLGG